MTGTIIRTTATAGILLLALSGCAGGNTSAPVLDGEWTLSSMTENSTELPVAPPVVTLTIAGEQINGQGPCNSYGAQLVGSTGTFDVDGIMGTQMACDFLDLEQKYFGTLDAIDSVDLQGETLTLSSSSTDTILVFTSAD